MSGVAFELFKDAEINIIKSNESIHQYVDDINQSDVVVLGGGPAYTSTIYPKVIPLVDDLSEIKVPFFAMALGWNGTSVAPKSIYTESFSPKTRKLMDRIE